MKNNPVAKHAHKANKSAVMRDRKKDSKKGVVKHKGRDYAKEYANYHSDPEQIKRRAARNAARRALRGRKDLTDEKDVHHKDNNPMNNDKSNLSIVTQHYNRREPRLRMEDLRKWFGKGKKGDWVRVGTDGEIKGDCAREPGEGKPKCMPRDKAHSMDKKDRASSARRKRRADPDADRPGTGNKPIMVKTDKKESVEMKEAVFSDRQVKAAIKIAHDMPNDKEGAIKKINQIRRGLSDDPMVAVALRSSGKSMALNRRLMRQQKESVGMNEKTKWKMGDGRPRNGARIENDRFWNLPKAQLMYIRKDAAAAVKANPNGKKAGKYADEVNDAETVLGWRKKNGIRENAFVNALITSEDQMNEQFVVSYAKSKRGAIFQSKFRTQGEAEKFLAQKKKEGMNGIVSKAGQPVSMQKMKDLQKEEYLDEKSVPTNPSLWSKFKSQAKAKFDVYPSAYANGWAAKQYKAAGGGWKNESVEPKKTFSQMRESGKPELEEGAEVYVVKKGAYTRRVDGATADRMKKDGWQLVSRSNENKSV